MAKVIIIIIIIIPRNEISRLITSDAPDACFSIAASEYFIVVIF